MKKTLISAAFATICAAGYGQFVHRNTIPQVWYNTPALAQGTPANELVINTATGQMLQAAPGTFLSTEADSIRNYTFGGSQLCSISAGHRDTVTLRSATLPAYRRFSFYVTYSGADTVVFVPTAGNIAGSAAYPLTGTYTGLTLFLDGVNYWVVR